MGYFVDKFGDALLTITLVAMNIVQQLIDAKRAGKNASSGKLKAARPSDGSRHGLIDPPDIKHLPVLIRKLIQLNKVP